MHGQQRPCVCIGLKDRGYNLLSLLRPRICCNIDSCLWSVRSFLHMNLFTAMNIGSHESMQEMQKKIGHVSIVTVQNRVTLVAAAKGD